MPAPLPSQPRRVDWTERDERRLADVRRVVAEMRASKGRPERIARSTLMKRAGFSSGERHQIERLPRTCAYLEEVEESAEAFAERRVRWVAQQLRGAGEGLYKPKPSRGISALRLAHEANLTRSQATDLGDLLNLLADPPPATS
jgi:Tn7-like transposition protein D